MMSSMQVNNSMPSTRPSTSGSTSTFAESGWDTISASTHNATISTNSTTTLRPAFPSDQAIPFDAGVDKPRDFQTFGVHEGPNVNDPQNPFAPELRGPSPTLSMPHNNCRRASRVVVIDDDDTARFGMPYTDWVFLEEQRLGMARVAARRNRRNTALAVLVSFICLIGCIIGFGFLLSYDSKLRDQD